MNAAEQLAILAAELEESAPAPDTPAAFFVAGIRRWLSGSARSMDDALGLTGSPGIETARTRYLRHRRDAHLLTAWRLLDGKPTPRAAALADAIRRFESDIWPRWRDLEAPPASASSLGRAVWEARRCGSLPTSARQLQNIAESNRLY